MTRPAPSGSSLGSTQGGKTAPSGSSISAGKQRQATTTGGQVGKTRNAPSSIKSTRRIPGTPVIGALSDRSGKSTPFNVPQTLGELQTQFSTIIEQKLYASILANMVGREVKAFDDFAKRKKIKVNTPKDIADFINLFETGDFTTNSRTNQKIEKLLKYIPDIIGSLAKNEAIAPASKVIAGENPVVDEIKFATEKVIAPSLKKVGELMEKRLGSEIGKKIGASLIKWGERLATLPTKVLEGVGLPDIVLSVVDAGLLAIDQATGNYRQQTHYFPDAVFALPIVGQTIEILSSIRDLVDSAVGIPTDSQAIPKLYSRLQTDLWRPIISEYNKVMGEFSSKEKVFDDLRKKAEVLGNRAVLYDEVIPNIGEIAKEFGNDRKSIKNFISKELGIKKGSQLEKDIDLYIDFEIGRISKEELDARLSQDKVDVPEVKQVISGAEVVVRQALDNVYSSQTLLTGIEDSIKSKEESIKKLQEQNRKDRLIVDARIRMGFTPSRKLRDIRNRTALIDQTQQDIKNLKDEIPKVTAQIKELHKTFEDRLAEAEDLGVDLTFLKKSANWDKALADIEDDTFFWNTFSEAFGGTFGGGMF